jgi:hypothetical protein
LALTFGHVHAALGGDSVSWPMSVRLASEAPVDLSVIPVAPAKRAALADFCAICANIHLAGALLLADPPSSPLTPAASKESRASVAGFELSGTKRGPFRARAPPLA